MFQTEHLDFLTDTYNGKTGCACGCTGSYASAESLIGQKRIARLLNSKREVKLIEFGNGEGCYEIENRDGSRVLRVYYKVGA